jgi:hypothetical protein
MHFTYQLKYSLKRNAKRVLPRSYTNRTYLAASIFRNDVKFILFQIAFSSVF